MKNNGRKIMNKQPLKIAKMGFFATPDSVEVITDWIERHNPEERAHLYTLMGMTWNFLSEAVDTYNKLGDKSDGSDSAV